MNISFLLKKNEKKYNTKNNNNKREKYKLTDLIFNMSSDVTISYWNSKHAAHWNVSIKIGSNCFTLEWNDIIYIIIGTKRQNKKKNKNNKIIRDATTHIALIIY